MTLPYLDSSRCVFRISASRRQGAICTIGPAMCCSLAPAWCRRTSIPSFDPSPSLASACAASCCLGCWCPKYWPGGNQPIQAADFESLWYERCIFGPRREWAQHLAHVCSRVTTSAEAVTLGGAGHATWLKEPTTGSPNPTSQVIKSWLS